MPARLLPDQPGPGVATSPRLELDLAAGQALPCAVRLLAPDPALLSRIGALAGSDVLRSVLRVSVVSEDDDAAYPSISGRHDVTPDGVRFTPHFPFMAGQLYRASFEPEPSGWPETAVTLDFSEPAERGEPPEVGQIFPSADELPENLLRFHVHFSRPMRRGLAGSQVSLLDSGGQPIPDVLYNAPVELWDRDMRWLTVLLDPGRLKRDVGPNRALGPPLQAGRSYALSIGAGMTGSSGLGLPETVLKRFRATPPVREPVATKDWTLVPPAARSRERLLLRFVRPLDRVLLQQAVTVSDEGGQAVDGRFETGMCETEVGFTPTMPWAPARHRVSVSAELEDVCGNRGIAAFDGPVRRDRMRSAAAVPLVFDVHPR